MRGTRSFASAVEIGKRVLIQVHPRVGVNDYTSRDLPCICAPAPSRVFDLGPFAARGGAPFSAALVGRKCDLVGRKCDKVCGLEGSP